MNNPKGLLIILSAPGGSGKNSIIEKYLHEHDDTEFSISCTTRARRVDDDDNAYYFVSVSQFEDMIKNNELFEYVKFCDNYYGTPKKYIIDNIVNNKDVIMEIDYVGALKIKSDIPEAVLIFVLPPSLKELKKRLESRASDSKERIMQRIIKGKEEAKNAYKFDYLIINDKLEEAYRNIDAIIQVKKNIKDCPTEYKIIEENCKIQKKENIDFIHEFINQIDKYKKKQYLKEWTN